MATLSVVYPRTPGATFDYDYYRSKHMPLVTQRWANAGLLGGEALLGNAAPDGSEAPYFAIGIIHFDTRETSDAAMNGEHAPGSDRRHSQLHRRTAGHSNQRPVHSAKLKRQLSTQS